MAWDLGCTVSVLQDHMKASWSPVSEVLAAGMVRSLLLVDEASFSACFQGGCG